MKKLVLPTKIDPILTPREVAETILGHKEFPRSERVIYNTQKKVQAACRRYLKREQNWDYYGLVCSSTPTGRLEIKLTEVKRWADRLRLWGYSEKVAVNG